jgi:hypothetical protein
VTKLENAAVADDPPTDFSDHPTSISEARATRDDNAALWTPRDALIACLRDLDRGNLDPVELAIIVTERAPDGLTRMHYYQRSDSTLSLSGLYSTALHDLHAKKWG